MRLGVLIVAVLGLGVLPLVAGCGSSSLTCSPALPWSTVGLK